MLDYSGEAPYDGQRMYDLKELDKVDRDFAEQDKRWNAPKFFATGIVTLIIAISIIVFAATRTGCTLAIVP